jgi:hypothetical protein
MHAGAELPDTGPVNSASPRDACRARAVPVPSEVRLRAVPFAGLIRFPRALGDPREDVLAERRPCQGFQCGATARKPAVNFAIHDSSVSP